ncbi:MAG: topoisomerase C-terminal repeat-containing protein, partial [Robiginitalea sp.]|nr:topoisomerase C-terminal repeat-containing protein [Robiginitalea sp.]
TPVSSPTGLGAVIALDIRASEPGVSAAATRPARRRATADAKPGERSIKEEKADAPIAYYEGREVTKGKGRFGPYIKWDGMFINVNKKYDFDDLSEADIAELIEAKKKKEAEKLVREWPEEKIRIEKGRWGRHQIIKGRTRVDLSKDVDPLEVSLEQAQELLAKKKPKKRTK